MKLSAIVGLLMLPVASMAQVVPAGPPRDRVAPKQSGTATLQGRVVDGLTGRPIARSSVRLLVASSQWKALTNADGEFAFSSLPAGRASLYAEKSTYLQGHFPEPSRTFRSVNRPLILGEGQAVADIVVKMYHGSSITGRVLDAHGDPLENASVNAMRMVPGGQPQIRAGTQTNDLGEFRLGRLQPGSYVLIAVPPRFGQANEPTAGGEPPQPVATYFPNAVSADAAQPIAVGRGDAITGVELVLAEATAAVVNGIVIRQDGEAVSTGHIQARQTARAHPGMGDSTGTSVRPDGTFRLVLSPGEYILQAFLPTRRTDGPPAPGSEQSGMLRVTIGASPAESITIVAGPGASASGRIVFEGTSPPPPVPSAPVHVPLYSQDGGCRSGLAKVAANWAFRVEGLMGTCSPPRHRRFGRWTLKAVTRAGDDLLHSPVTFEPGQHIDSLLLVFTDRQSELTFSVSTGRGQVTQDYVALVFPTDRTRWTEQPVAEVHTFHLPLVDEMRGLQPTLPPGTFPPLGEMRRELIVIPPGEYFVIAVDDIAHEDTRVPAVLERLATSATRVIVSEGAKMEVALRRLQLRDVVR